MTDIPDRFVECPTHGRTGPAFVCRHLNLGRAVGFVEGYDPADPEGEIFHAWCGECDDVLQSEGDWNDRSEAFAGVRLVCRECYRVMRDLNRPR